MEISVHSLFQKMFCLCQDGLMEMVCEHQYSILAIDYQLAFNWAMTMFDLNHSILALAVCLGPLSCWTPTLLYSLPQTNSPTGTLGF